MNKTEVFITLLCIAVALHLPILDNLNYNVSDINKYCKLQIANKTIYRYDNEVREVTIGTAQCDIYDVINLLQPVYVSQAVIEYKAISIYNAKQLYNYSITLDMLKDICEFDMLYFDAYLHNNGHVKCIFPSNNRVSNATFYLTYSAQIFSDTRCKKINALIDYR